MTRILATLTATLLLVTFISAPAWGMDTETARQKTKQAEELLQEGRFEQAAEIYASLWREGIRNADIAYNAGTAYLKANKLGWGILFLERAKRLSPKDDYIRQNLSIAKRQKKSLPGEHSQQAKEKGITLHGIVNLLSLDGWALLLVTMLWATALVLVMLPFVSKRKRLGMLLTAFSLLIISGAIGGLFMIKHDTELAPWGVAVSDTEAKEGPHHKFQTLFKVPEGTKVIIEDNAEGWELVKTPNKLEGYVPEDAVRKI